MDDAWKRFARLIGGENFAGDRRLHDAAGRNANRVEILARVRECTMAQASVRACGAALDAAGVAAAPVQTIDQVLADPQALAPGMVVGQDHALLGQIRLPNLPFRFSDCDTSPRGAAPLLGQHNRMIAGELGYVASEIESLVHDGVLYAEPSVSRLVD